MVETLRFSEITQEWIENSNNKIGQVKMLEDFFFYKGIGYKIDNHFVKYELKKGEKKFAEWLAKNYNKTVILLPKINYPENIRTPDFFIEDEYFDFKYTTGYSNQLIYHNLYGKKKINRQILF